MIKIQDWMATIPDADKHVAYVGEGLSETREFFLCGDGWERYQDWSFHLDMAFDPESITTRDTRQVVQTISSSNQMKEEAAVNTEESVIRESYTVVNEAVTNHNLTDIAPLEKHVEAEGIRLVWEVLRQHTVLPGKLWATLRAVDSTAQKVKKSAVMVFEVDAAICAVPAARPAVSEMEQIEARVAATADGVTADADRAEAAVDQCLEQLRACQDQATQTETAKERAAAYAGQAEQMYNLSVGQVSAAAAARTAAEEQATAAEEQAAAAATHANFAALRAADTERCYGLAAQSAEAASTACEEARQAATDAADAADHAAQAVDKCSRYVTQCGNHATTAQRAAQAVAAVENAVYKQVNVRDYGAVGNGTTDDRAAILAAFEAAKGMLPCEVYFPAGTYGISNGMTVELPCGKGGLSVRGAGMGVSVIRCLTTFTVSEETEWELLAIRPDRTPTDESEYLHSITVTDLSLSDPYPTIHRNETQSTHGLAVQYAASVTIHHCGVDTIGGSAFVLDTCRQASLTDNHVTMACLVLGAVGAIAVDAVGAVVKGCHVETFGSCAIREKGGDGNLFVCNVVNGPLVIVGGTTLSSYNVDLRKVTA